jgi:serine/threonine protein kinase
MPGLEHGVEPIEFIGRGGMGAVYKGHQKILDRIVALKVMPPRGADGGSIIHRFESEARLLARFNHPNVVAVYQYGLAGNLPYFTMDFVDGPSLRQRLKSGALIPSEAVKLFLQLCDGLQHAHQFGVIHRDIKPENLLVDKGGLLKIADFGLAKLNGDRASTEWQTRDGRRMGTIYYMAPEQLEKPQAVDHRADIYSAGVVLYEMLTGELPIGRFSAPSKKAKVDSSWDVVLDKALEKDVTRRYQHIGEFKQAVEAVKAADEDPGDVRVWQKLKQVYDRLNYEDGSISATRKLVELYSHQGRLAEAILEGQKLMLRLPKDSKLFFEVRHQTNNLNTLLLMTEDQARKNPGFHVQLEYLKNAYSTLDIDDKREYFTRKLAEAYVLKRKWPQAISEYRELLHRHRPARADCRASDDDVIKEIIADLEERQRQEPPESRPTAQPPFEPYLKSAEEP